MSVVIFTYLLPAGKQPALLLLRGWFWWFSPFEENPLGPALILAKFGREEGTRVMEHRYCVEWLCWIIMSTQLKWNWNKTVLKLFCFSFVSVLFQLCGQVTSQTIQSGVSDAVTESAWPQRRSGNKFHQIVKIWPAKENGATERAQTVTRGTWRICRVRTIGIRSASAFLSGECRKGR